MYWLRERVHPTWHVTAMCLGFICGVAIARVYSSGQPIIFILGVVLIGLGFWRLRRMLLVLVFLGGGCVGLWRGAVAVEGISQYEAYYGQEVTIEGAVADDIDLKPQGAHVPLNHVRINGQSMPGAVFATVMGANEARRSDTIQLTGRMDSGFGAYAATITGRAEHVKRPIGGDIPLELRDGFASHVREAISEPEASLGIGYLLGQKSTLPNDLIDALKITGLTHIVVASGYNLTILVRIGRRLFARISKYLAMITGAGLIVGFIAMTGLSPSMSRAGLVAGLGLWAWYYGRKFHPVTLLGLAAAATVAVNPSYVWGDLGWLLSFAAFAGVMIVAPIITAYFFSDDDVPFIGQLLIETISAQIATLPIMIVAFHQLSLIAPLANLLVLPLIPFIMLLVAGAGLLVVIIPPVAQLIGWLAEQLLHLQVAIISWCADIPWALEKPTWGWLAVSIYIITVTIVVGYMKLRTGYKLYQASIVE